jgi:4-hydroxybenzoate polyprenyltransferase
MKRIKGVIDRIVARDISLTEFLVGYLSVLALRVFIEEFLASAGEISVSEVLIEYIHNLNFFTITLVLIWLFLSYLLRVNPKRLSFLIVSASTMIIFPPLLDMIRTGGEVYWSFYLISTAGQLVRQFATVFGELPSGIVYFGTKIIFIMAIGIITLVIWSHTKSWLKIALGAIGTYVILFLMGSFPSVFSFLYYSLFGKNFWDVQSFEIIQLFARPQHIWGLHFTQLGFAFPYKLNILYYPILILLLSILFWAISKKKMVAVLANFRYPQIIYHSGLFLLGMGLGYIAFPIELDRLSPRTDNSMLLFSLATSLTLLISIWLAWKASVVVNDIADVAIDTISNPSRPLPKGIFTHKEYAEFGGVCFLLSLLGGLTIGLPFFVLLLIYQIIAWFYSGRTFRLKRIPIVATLVSAVASLIILFMGFCLMSPDQSIDGLSPRIIFLLLITYTISIPIKDFKDIEGDKEDGVRTVPVILGEEKGRLVVAACLFFSHIISVFFLNEFRLFFWALLSGIISFFIVNSATINPRRLPWWVLLVVSIYSLILVQIVFLS